MLIQLVSIISRKLYISWSKRNHHLLLLQISNSHFQPVNRQHNIILTLSITDQSPRFPILTKRPIISQKKPTRNLDPKEIFTTPRKLLTHLFNEKFRRQLGAQQLKVDMIKNTPKNNKK